jgi:hypothetical protein
VRDLTGCRENISDGSLKEECPFDFTLPITVRKVTNADQMASRQVHERWIDQATSQSIGRTDLNFLIRRIPNESISFKCGHSMAKSECEDKPLMLIKVPMVPAVGEIDRMDSMSHALIKNRLGSRFTGVV